MSCFESLSGFNSESNESKYKITYLSDYNANKNNVPQTVKDAISDYVKQNLKITESKHQVFFRESTKDYDVYFLVLSNSNKNEDSLVIHFDPKTQRILKVLYSQ